MLRTTFYTKLGAFSIVTLALMFCWKQFAAERYQSELIWAIWAFFVVTTAVIHYVLVEVSDRDPKKFVGYFMGITGVKLLVYLCIITVYALLKRGEALGFTLLFLVLYLLYSGFEVIQLMRHFRNQD